MSQSELTTNYPPRLWPSLLIAAILATVLPVMWLSLNDPFGLKLIFAPVYIPVAFGIFWPAIIAVQRWTSPTREPWFLDIKPRQSCSWSPCLFVY
jgi:hypothetical protein